MPLLLREKILAVRYRIETSSTSIDRVPGPVALGSESENNVNKSDIFRCFIYPVLGIKLLLG
jgi:hypothetical protein